MGVEKDYPGHPDLTGSGETDLHSHAGGGGIAYKSGSILVPDRTWTAVTFNTPFADANYAITFGINKYMFIMVWEMLVYCNKATTGFEIFTKDEANQTVYIDWMATPYNDP